MKTILSILFALVAFTVIPTTQAKADLYNAGGMAAIASQSAVAHRHNDHYYGRPSYRGGHRNNHYRRSYNRGYNRHHNGSRRSGVIIRF